MGVRLASALTWMGDDARLGIDASLPEAWIASRYETGALLGIGGSSRVHRARDHLTGRDVAVKIASSRTLATMRHRRRELMALRLMALPGVVELLDEGQIDDDQAFIVMELLPGGHFDELASRGGWETWSTHAQALLESLARVHFAGVTHRDLKPGNILLSVDDRPVITDFGLAREPGERARPLAEGTPGYMAPEQLRGEVGDARVDLFAIGVMFSRMLENQHGPNEVLEVVQAMCSPAPEDRPASAVEVLSAMGASAQAVVGPAVPLPEISTAGDLARLFWRPPRTFVHVAEDAADVLLRRTGGVRSEVEAELNRWVRAGRCHWRNDHLAMDRSAIDHLLAEDDPGVRMLVNQRANLSDADLSQHVVRHAHRLAVSGASLRASSLLRAALSTVSDPEAARPMLEHLAAIAAEIVRRDELRLAMYHCQRVLAMDLLRLLHGVRLIWRGEVRRAIPYLQSRLSGEAELTRLSHMVLAAGATSHEAAQTMLANAKAACEGHPVLEGRWRIWNGNAAYARGDYEEAVRYAMEAADLLTTAPGLQIAAWLNAGFAALEVPNFRLTRELAQRAAHAAQRGRHAAAECMADQLERVAAFRSGVATSAEPEVVDAAYEVSDRTGAERAFIEATVAYRSGQHELARRLVRRTVRSVPLRPSPLPVLAQALAVALNDEPPDGFATAREGLSDPVRAQAEALLVDAGQHPRPPREEVLQWLSTWPSLEPDQPLDVLSLSECQERLLG